MKLYQLTDNYNKVWRMIDNEETDLQIMKDTLESIEGAIEVKAQNTISLLKNLEVYSDGLEKEIKRLERMQDALNNKYDAIRNYLFSQLESAGLTEIKTSIATIKQQNNPPSVVIEKEESIPAKYITVIPQSYKIIKTEIAKDLKAGINVAGASLQHSKRWVVK